MQLDHPVIDRLLRSGRVIRLPFNLERRFELARYDRRRRDMTITAALAVFLLSMFGITDPLLLPDVVHEALLIRFGILVPAAALYLITLRVRPRIVLRQWPMQLLAVIGAACLAIQFAMSRAPEAINYYYGVALVVLFSNVMAQPKLRLGIVATVAVLAIFDTGLWWHGASTAVIIGAVMFSTNMAVVTLYAAFKLEQNERRHFLLDQRDRLRRQELAHRNQELSALSDADPLTGISNRRSFQAPLARAWKVARTQDLVVACLMMDVDHFKALNDSLGHAEGDRCLQLIAGAVRESVRAGDVVARYGGEEFVAILPGTDAATAMEVAERVRQTVEELGLNHPSSPIGVLAISVGVASMWAREGDADSLVRAADAALYAAKAAGRNRVVGRNIAQRPRPFLVELPEGLVPGALNGAEVLG